MAAGGNIDRVREVIDAVATDSFPELEGWSPWVFAGLQGAHARLEAGGFTSVRCWLEEQPTRPDDLAEFVRSTILPAHIARLPEERREPFAIAVLERVRQPLRLRLPQRLGHQDLSGGITVVSVQSHL